MKGVITICESKRRYALRTDAGLLSVFQMLSERVGLKGDLETIGLQTLGSGEHGEVNASSSECTASPP